jgi:hypothetical protein
MIGRFAFGLLLALVAGLIVKSVPDLVRYQKLRAM